MNIEKLKEILAAMESKVGHVGSTGNLNSECPLAPWLHGNGTDKSMSLSIKVEDPFPLHCFACETKGTLATLQKRYAELSGNAEILKQKIVASGGNLKRGIHKTTSPFREEDLHQYRVLEPLPYVLKRGVTPEQFRRWELGWDEYRKRITFPIRDYSRKLMGVCGRVKRNSKKEPKYRLYSGTRKDSALYGEQFINRTLNKCILVEGPFDVFCLENLGYQNVLAMMGNSVSDEQKRKLISWFSEMIILPDFDDNGVGLRAAQEFLEKQFSKSLKVGIAGVAENSDYMKRTQIRTWLDCDYRFQPLSILNGKDPADMSGDDIRTALKSVGTLQT